MSTPTLAKGKTAILVMDCQNDIVHEQREAEGTPP
jgi:nicotinamidase-related amidase